MIILEAIMALCIMVIVCMIVFVDYFFDDEELWSLDDDE